MVRQSSIGWLALVLAILAGCSGQQVGTGPDHAKPVPAYADIVAAHNTRVERLDRLWARAVVVIRYVGEDGKRHKDQGEGHLQVARPDRLALTVGALGETYIHVGCDADRYWWFNLRDGKRVWVGRHDRVRQRAAGDGMVVHPLDLIQLLGVTPLPEGEPLTGPAWSDDGRTVGVTVPARWGVRRLWFEPKRYEPTRIELLDETGRLVLSAKLGEYEYVKLHGDGTVPPRVASQVLISDPAGESEVSIRLWDPENRRLSRVAFDFDRLVRAYRVEDVIDVDQE
jgi:hypothetical protein